MIIGFTGTKMGMTAQQMRVLHIELRLNWCWGALKVNEFHHGDCVGADAEAHDLAMFGAMTPYRYITVAHPPTDGKLRAYKRADYVKPCKPYLERNRDIVNSVALMLAMPDGPERLRSGTWSTIRYARKIGKPVKIIMPDGTLSNFT